MSLLELLANVFNVASVMLAAQNRVATWPLGIVGSCLYILVFFDARLYAEVQLQIFFIFTSFYGWWLWKHGGPERSERPIASISVVQHTGFALTALFAALIHAFLLSRFTNASYPYPDSFILTFSVLGQLLLMRRVVQSWWSWIAVDTVALPLYAIKGLHITALVYLVFLANAVRGLIVWRRSLRTV